MPIVPKNTAPRITWYQTRLAPWAEHSAAIGVSAADVALLEAKVAAAREKRVQQQRARQAARVATHELKLAMEELSQVGSSMVQQIKARAAMEGGNVYALAWMPAPADPSPIAAPGKPGGFDVQLLQDGAIRLKWKCDNPRGSQGTIYEVARSDGPYGEFKFIGVSGVKTFHDATIPPGTARVTYQVTPLRGRRRGTSSRYEVNFGGGMPVRLQADGVARTAA